MAKLIRSLVLEDIPTTQQERLAYLELRVRFLGECGRRELLDRFSIQEAAATRDFAAYRALAPNNLDFDSSLKRYLPSATFSPIFDISPERALSWLSQGFGDGISTRHKGHVFSEPVPFISKPDLGVVAVLSRAIHQRKVVKIRYCSLSSGNSNREIVPFALANSGWRWHIRAFDRKNRQFRDFVLTRIISANLMDESSSEDERPERDNQWNRIVELELIPHPDNVTVTDAIKRDLAIEDDCAQVPIRAALAGYLLRLWNVDVSPDHRMRGHEYQLWLRNSPALYGVQNLSLAPGYVIDAGKNEDVDL